jgi:Putative redox-active protein (C_GCAxxG_C_C)
VLALQDTFDMKDETLLKAAGALTGGIGGKHDACGSLLGSTLILGSVYGRGRKDEGDKGIAKIQKSIKQAGDFYKWFKGEQGTATCREIVTKFGNGVFYDFGIPEQAKAGSEAGVVDKCNKLVQDSVSRVTEILWDERHKGKNNLSS